MGTYFQSSCHFVAVVVLAAVNRSSPSNWKAEVWQAEISQSVINSPVCLWLFHWSPIHRRTVETTRHLMNRRGGRPLTTLHNDLTFAFRLCFSGDLQKKRETCDTWEIIVSFHGHWIHLQSIFVFFGCYHILSLSRKLYTRISCALTFVFFRSFVRPFGRWWLTTLMY